ncbi:DUF2911 domain-containing protein [Opitutia bacterium ISCC 51]|nr:DUF2911 domain-containing protein [Opitutae bacterium ISCC 51]QXD27286.1 DUF2911 domain-containing protein [Opitutae bacterium ISCC 52]
MKSLIRISAVALAILLATSSFSFAQKRGNGKARPSPNAEVSQTIGTTVISITYGRPGLKGRKIEDMVPDGKVWRTGANESTVITLSDDIMIGDASVKAGTYSMYTKPNADDKTMDIIINSKLSWGTQYDESKDVVRATAKLTRENHPNEWFAIYFTNLSNNSADMKLHWGDAIAVIPISAK